MKFKVIPVMLSMLLALNYGVLADDEINANDQEYNDIFNELFNSKIPIEGMDDCYIMTDVSAMYVNIVNGKGEKLVDQSFRNVENKLGDYDTIIVHYPEGMADSSMGLLNKDFKTIVPPNFYVDIDFVTINGKVCVEADNWFGDESDYYDLDGNKIDNIDWSTAVYNAKYSKWAKKSIKYAVACGLVPEYLQSNYKNKITRQEFCALAVQTYISKTGNEIDLLAKTPFKDIDDIYVTNAYNLKIVSGVGDDNFAPNNNITRQEAAVMLNNLANVIGIKSTPNTEKFIDESYFADWAKKSIYAVTGIKSEDTFVMVGTEPNKFSPWMNYTREQAIATMLRLYNC